ncbi:methyltransferase domain-containing protein [Flavitalea sp. BT771]|uniref:class I SAM-dependent methyltransferase n=1 Tax=Flavitalea sp. BT771 TaxID=3063329 RepID=UPI0026E159B6|nr:class I SAM-dependent methyltransferase [Flavitalea sp. BT771]MDO6431665.1 methyltransferase domain-containing protein [Flavitalea sp. BT771]MDV6220573.1 methyltransferase domain-containing protein [Flavitalea sp. BT771]
MHEVTDLKQTISAKDNIADNWYENFFEGINCEMWEKAATIDMTLPEVNFLLEIFGLPAVGHLLDLPCGNGRHSVELAKQGFQMTAFDISETFIRSLQQKLEDQKLSIRVIHGNILTHSLTGSFDGAFCLGNSFGYFPYEQMELFVRKISGVLKPGAKWVINTGLAAETFLTKFVDEKTYVLGDLTMDIQNDYDEWSSCLLTTLTYTKNNRKETKRFKHYIHTVAEIIRLLQRFGLKTIDLYGSTGKTEYRLGGMQLFLVAEKEA